MSFTDKAQIYLIKIFEKSKILPLLWKMRPLREKLWNLLAQPGELSFHRTLGKDFRMSDDFVLQTKSFFEKFNYKPHDFRNRKILDLGAGSKMRSLYFEDADIYVIEPLAKKFSKLPQSDLHKARMVISEPAESYVSDFSGKFDFIMCINVLDHCYDDYLVLSNIYKYLKPDGEFLLSVDIHESHYDPMHPVSLTKEKLLSSLTKIGYNIKETYDAVGDFTDHEFSITLKLAKKNPVIN